MSKPIFGDKNMKNISKCHLFLLVGQVVLWVWGELFWASFMWGRIQLCLVYCLILMISMIIFKLCRNEENQPFGCTSRNKKTILAIRNAKEEHFCDCHSKKNKKHPVHLKRLNTPLLNHYPNVAKHFIFVPIPVRKLSVKTSYMI